MLYYNTSGWASVPSAEGGPPRRKRSPRPPSEWIAISIPVLIDREVFERSQARHGHNQQFSPRNLHEEHWLLRRRVRCGRCGLKCACVADKRRPHLPPAYYYRWGPPRLPGCPSCRPSHARAHPLDALVWEEVRKVLLRPELLVRAQTKVQESASLDSSFLSNQIDNARKRVARIRDERRRLLDAYQSGFLQKKESADRAQPVARRLETLRKELQALRQEHQRASEGRQLLERIQAFASVLTQRLDTMSFAERQALVRTVLEEVVLCGDTVKLCFKIPLPKASPPNPPTGGSPGNGGVSNQFDLRSRSDEGVDVRVPVDQLAEGVNRGDHAGHRVGANAVTRYRTGVRGGRRAAAPHLRRKRSTARFTACAWSTIGGG